MNATPMAALMAGIVLSLPGAVAAQQDLEAWLEAGAQYEVIPDLRITARGHLRLDRDASRFERVMPEAEIRYRLHKRLAVGAGYRFIYKRDGGGEFELGHRMYLDTRVRWPVGPLQLGYRLRGQQEYEQNKKREMKAEPTLRNALTLSYGSGKSVSPFLSAEHFLALDAKRTGATRKWRATAGVEVGRRLVDVAIFYRVEIPVEKSSGWTHIVGASFCAEILDRGPHD